MAQHRRTSAQHRRPSRRIGGSRRIGAPFFGITALLGAVIVGAVLVPGLTVGAAPEAAAVVVAPAVAPPAADTRQLAVAPLTETAAPSTESTAPADSPVPAAELSFTAPAAPATPKTSAEAKTAWLEASRQAEAVNELVLQAQEAAVAAAQAVDDTEAAVVAAASQVADADRDVAAAAAALQGYQGKLDAFASASFRGARLGQLSTLLSADTAEDFLDQASSLNHLAEDTQHTIASARDAESAALAARATADEARVAAGVVREAALAAASAAEQAVVDVNSYRTDLDARIAEYRELTTSLTVSDRAAAIAEFEDANLTDETRARHLAQAAVRAEAGISETDGNLTEVLDLANTAPNTQAAIAVTAALSAEGLPYVWGAVGPDSFDCSGLMLWAWAKAGVTIPRTSAAQAGMTDIPLDELQPGDLVTYYSPVTHVGMYIGHGLVIHASTEGVPIKVADLYKAGPNPSGHRPDY